MTVSKSNIIPNQDRTPTSHARIKKERTNFRGF
jgi:hypothetical protein